MLKTRSRLGRTAAHVGQRAIGQGLGEMHAANRVGAVEIGERARHPQHAVIAAGGKPHGVGGIAQQCQSAAVRSRHVFEQRPVR